MNAGFRKHIALNMNFWNTRDHREKFYSRLGEGPAMSNEGAANVEVENNNKYIQESASWRFVRRAHGLKHHQHLAMRIFHVYRGPVVWLFLAFARYGPPLFIFTATAEYVLNKTTCTTLRPVLLKDCYAIYTASLRASFELPSSQGTW